MENRAGFWSKLSQVGNGRDSAWLITGDFNDILTNAEKVGGPTRAESSFNHGLKFFHWEDVDILGSKALIIDP